MNIEEARTVAGIMTTADGGCGTCFDELARQMKREFPDFEWWALGKEVEKEFEARALKQFQDELAES